MDKKEASKEYNKKYYEEHKEKMMKQLKDLTPERERRKIVLKLNNNEYTRIPYTKIKKYDIKIDNETNKYY